VKPCEKTP